jgi:large subunit ribosomal protein L18
MAKSGNYRVQLRRRREGKTDYQARKALVVSRKPRLVTRPTLKNVTVQITIAKPHGDEVLASANSRELIKNYGWKAPTGNVPAAYLTGLLCGLKAKNKGVEEAILDIGLISPTKGSKIFAILNGVLDGGVNVPHSEEKIVKERMKGEHIAKYAKSLGAGSEEYTAKFSKYTAQNLAPEKISEHFSKVKAEITGTFKAGKQATEAVAKAPAEKEAPVEKEEKAPAKKAAAAKPKTAAKKPAAPKEKASKKGEKKA